MNKEFKSEFKPELNKIYTLKEIKDAYGLLRSFAFWSKGKVLSAFTLNPRMNPSLMDHEKSDTLKILVAKGRLRESNLNRVQLNKQYPVFIKDGPNKWKFIGAYNYCGFTKNKLEIAPKVKNLEIKLDEINCVITLEKVAVSLKVAA